MVEGPEVVVANRKVRGRHSFIAVLVVLLMTLGPLLVFVPAPAGADLTYSFSVTKEAVDVHIKKDGGIDIDYTIDFVNYADMDGIDIGAPNRYYDLGSAQGSIIAGGRTYNAKSIEKSPYMSTGLAVNLDYSARNAIENKPGGTAFTLKLHFHNGHMVYENEKKAGTVGIQFRPTWFSSSYQRGSTGTVEQRVFFPPGYADHSSAVWLQNRPWNNISFDNASNLVVASWYNTNVTPSSLEAGSFDSGVGFPSKYVDKYFKNDFWSQLGDSFYEAGALACEMWPCTLIGLVVVVFVIWGWIAGKRRVKDYFEPELSVPGAGPRRDLTAVEAAIVLERPMEMVATMILFSVWKKGMVEIVSEDPLRVKPTGKPGELAYEKGFIAATDDSGVVDRSRLSDTLVELVKDTKAKVKGFDFKATKDYYGRICDKAWEEVKAAGTPDDFERGLQQQNDWMMLDPGYSNRVTTVYYGMPYHSHHHGSGKGVLAGAAGGGGLKSRGVGNMAETYSSRFKSSSSTLVTNMKGLASDVTKVTNPPPVSSSSGGGHGGGGCACACACACAGGGR